LGEINQNIHAEDAIKLAHVDDLRQIHGSEGDHAAQLRLHNKLAAVAEEILLAVMKADRLHLARIIAGAFSAFESLAAAVGSKNVDFPCFVKFNDICHRHGDAV